MPGHRHWDPRLHADDLASTDDYAELRAHIPEIVRAVGAGRESALAVAA
jgi:hypothetical protein